MKKKILILVIAIIILVVGVVTTITLKNKNENDVKQLLNNFISDINQKNYDAMYEKIDGARISKEDFVTRNKNIYEGIDAANISIEITDFIKENNNYKINYHEKMYTSAGEINFDNSVIIGKIGKQYKMQWSSNFIFPQLNDNQKVKVSPVKSRRGDILDRNGNKLATDGKIASVGIVPGKLGENKDENISKISELTGVSVDFINSQLGASWVKDDTFVPIKKISDSDTTLKESLLKVPGVLINKDDGRVYSLGKEAAHLIGYVQPISAEELETYSSKGYTSTSKIGKTGLEKAYEDKLRGIDGAEIYIVDEENNKVASIASRDKKDGEDVKLTIDSTLQKNLYEQLKDDEGLFVVMNPATGELLSLVSTPTFDSNSFVLGLKTEEWDALNNDEKKPLYNRFIQKYCPGSTFKPITGGIGLTTGLIDKDEDYGYSGTSWQKDSSWGNYHITTLTAYNGAKNLLNGLIHSDNIYFAQSALKIGSNTFTENLNKLKFNEQLDLPMNLSKSQYANNNGTTIDEETKLADSGYGQGSILVNPIHMASIYSAFYNEGNMLKPYIEYKEDKSPEILVESAFSKEAADTIKEDLIQVVENKEGTANDMKVSGVTIAGKTGTAELKASSEDTESGTLGWFNCFTIGKDGGDLLIISMVENEQDNQAGGSHYLIKKIKTLF